MNPTEGGIEAVRRRHGRRSPISFILALVLIGFGVLKLVEAIRDESYEGVGSIIIGGALALPLLLRMAKGRGVPFWLLALGVLLIGAGVAELAGIDLPWFALLLILLGLWLLVRVRIETEAWRNS